MKNILQRVEAILFFIAKLKQLAIFAQKKNNISLTFSTVTLCNMKKKRKLEAGKSNNQNTSDIIKL